MNITNTLRHAMLTVLLAISLTATAANVKTSVEQVSETVALTTAVDYVITSDKPFTTNGIVDIQATDHAVLILSNVRPQSAATMLAGHVLINGARAVDGQNCQLKLYNRGSIILPYTEKTVSPLTVYSEPNFMGDTASDFGLGNDGGFMNTLSDRQLNNRIRSFRLKRGYMVTFSLKARGRGYSRCFIAADADLEVSTLPAILDRSITSYRLFRWYDTGKPAIANDTRAETVAALGVTSCYSFGLGENRLPQAECVPHHIYEDWPSAAACGQTGYSPHMKTNNEPGNSADDHPQSVATILDNWENLMATGMRLCSPSSHDGSLNHLRQFLDSIDARGWRCDIIDLHCYWNEWNFYNSIKTWTDTYHRPIWISEWVWGSSWGNNGIFAEATGANRDNPTSAQLEQNKQVVERICNALNGYNYIERYYYWNSEANCSKLYYNGQLTPAGEMYSKLEGPLAYNGSVAYIPRTPRQSAPGELALVFNAAEGKASVSWKENNGEQNEYIHIERRTAEGSPWEVVADVAGPETPGMVTVEGLDAMQGWEFRLVEKDAAGKTHTTRAVMAVSNSLATGDAVSINGATRYIGGNIIANPRFDMGLATWTNGKGEPLAAPWFEAVSRGATDGGSFLQCIGNGTLNSEQSIKTTFPIEPGRDYFFRCDAAALPGSATVLTLSSDGINGESIVAMHDNTSDAWASKLYTFNSGNYTHAIVAMRSLGAKARLGGFMLCPLFNTREEALANGAATERNRAAAVAAYATAYAQSIEQATASDADYATISQTLNAAIRATNIGNDNISRLADDATQLASSYPFDGSEDVIALAQQLRQATEPTDIVTLYDKLSEALSTMLPLEETTLVAQPTFASVTPWRKTGTYTAGQQLAATDSNGQSHWSALWTIEPSDSQADITMGVAQDVANLPHGLYSLACDATTWHYCLSDQHAWLTTQTDSTASPRLTADGLDLSIDAAARWQTLTTKPLYVDEGESVTIGFEGSKQGATDMFWRPIGDTKGTVGDHREGSWAATNFRLLFHPLYIRPATTTKWGTVCLPRDAKPAPGTTLYTIAAITHDYSSLCLEQTDYAPAGVPVIYHCDGDKAIFLEEGEAVTAATDGSMGLRGYLRTAARALAGYYVLGEDGTWTKVTSSNRPRIDNFTAVLRPLNDKATGTILRVDTWQGPSMPIHGVTDEEIAASISTPHSDSNATQRYTLSGQKANSQDMKPGIYIEVKNGKATKTLNTQH